MREEKKEVSVAMEYGFRLYGSLPATAVIGPQKVAMRATNHGGLGSRPPMMQMRTNSHVLNFVETVDGSAWDSPSWGFSQSCFRSASLSPF